MPRRDHHQSSGGQFPDTEWSLVLRAAGPTAPLAKEALNALCSAYWYPIYAFIRRKGSGVEEAFDLTQEYFLRLQSKHTLASLDPAKGRFRSFLRTDCSHFLIDQHRYRMADKRDPGQPILSIDARTAEGRYRNEPAHGLTPERAFERSWARTLLDRVLARLRQDYTEAGKSVSFEQLEIVLTEGSRSVSYAEIARRLNTTEGAVQTAVHRLRARYKRILREEITATVANPEDVDDEIRSLFEALRS